MLLCLFSVAGAMAQSVNSKMDVQLSVKPYLSLTVTNTVASVTVTSADISNGYVDLPLATTVTTTANTTNGYVMSVLLLTVTNGKYTVYPSGVVTVDAVPYALVPGQYTNVTVPYGGSPTQTKVLSYRFNLDPNILPGSYAWPVSIIASPL